MRQIDIELSNRCNLRCRMCWFHGEKGIGDRYEGCELTTREVFGVVDDIGKYTSSIYIGGSEPFIREDFMEILRHMKSKNLAVSFTTNGTLLDSGKIETLVALGVDAVYFSIDGNEELHDRVRGRGVFHQVTQSVRKLSGIKKRRMGVKPLIIVNIAVRSDLIGHVKESMDAIRNATDDGADLYRLHHLWYATPSELSRHQSAVTEKLSRCAVGAASHVIPGSFVLDPARLAAEIMDVSRLPKVRSYPDLSYTQIIKYYSKSPTVRKRCIASFFAAVIKPNGDVTFCPDEWIDDYILGNILNDSFHNIWNSEEAHKFRRVLLREKHFPGCQRCGWMYSY
ncbi:MAG TPA: radical SAM protein [Thermodesulfovibrionales bacterium]|nr:radical SAM protein [Thermodesulfovibrionales bacterium]